MYYKFLQEQIYRSPIGSFLCHGVAGSAYKQPEGLPGGFVVIGLILLSPQATIETYFGGSSLVILCSKLPIILCAQAKYIFTSVVLGYTSVKFKLHCQERGRVTGAGRWKRIGKL